MASANAMIRAGLARVTRMYVRVMTILLALLWIVIGYEATHRPPPRGARIVMRQDVRPRTPPEATAGLDGMLPSFSCQGESLIGAIDLLRRQSGHNIVLRVRGDNPADASPPRRISLSLHHVTLRAALITVIDYADPSLTYSVEPGGLIVVSSSTSQQPRSLRVYDIREIAPMPPTDPRATEGGGVGVIAWQSLWPERKLQVEIRTPKDHHRRHPAISHNPWPPSFDGYAPSPLALAATIETFLSPSYEDAHIQRVTTWAGRLLVWDNPENQSRVLHTLEQLRETQPGHQQ